MKMRLFFAVITMTILSLVSCQSAEENVISRLDRLYEQIQRDGANYDADDWAEVMEDFADIHEDMQDCEFSKEQLREIGKKEGVISAVIAKEGAKALNSGLHKFLGNFGAFSRGYMEGFTDEVTKNADEIKEIGNGFEDISTEFDTLGNELYNETNELIEAFDN